MRMRDFLGIVVAVVADAAQLGTSVVTLGADQLVVPAQVLFSAVVSVILAALMGPNPRLLPSAALELIPGLNVLPGFGLAAVWVALNQRKHPPSGRPPPAPPQQRLGDGG